MALELGTIVPYDNGAYNQAPQCVPSRSAMMVGLRTDQLGVIDNWFGGVAINGNASDPDDQCVKEFGASCSLTPVSRAPWSHCMLGDVARTGPRNRSRRPWR